MNARAIVGITVVAILITLYEWPKIKKTKKKEKVAFILFIGMGWGLAVLLIFFPDMKGPSHLIDVIFKPVYKTLEKFIGK